MATPWTVYVGPKAGGSALVDITRYVHQLTWSWSRTVGTGSPWGELTDSHGTVELIDNGQLAGTIRAGLDLIWIKRAGLLWGGIVGSVVRPELPAASRSLPTTVSFLDPSSIAGTIPWTGGAADSQDAVIVRSQALNLLKPWGPFRTTADDTGSHSVYVDVVADQTLLAVARLASTNGFGWIDAEWNGGAPRFVFHYRDAAQWGEAQLTYTLGDRIAASTAQSSVDDLANQVTVTTPMPAGQASVSTVVGNGPSQSSYGIKNATAAMLRTAPNAAIDADMRALGNMLLRPAPVRRVATLYLTDAPRRWPIAPTPVADPLTWDVGHWDLNRWGDTAKVPTPVNVALASPRPVDKLTVAHPDASTGTYRAVGVSHRVTPSQWATEVQVVATSSETTP